MRLHYVCHFYVCIRKKNSQKHRKTTKRKIGEEQQNLAVWNEESDVYVANIFKVQTAFIYSPHFKHAPLVIFNYLGMVMFRWKCLHATAANSMFSLGLPAVLACRFLVCQFCETFSDDCDIILICNRKCKRLSLSEMNHKM